MNTLFRLIASGKQKKALYLSILFQLLSAVFTLVSIPLVIPFFKILFNRNETDIEASHGMNELNRWLDLFFKKLIDYFEGLEALVAVCVSILIIFALKNIFRFLADYFLAKYRTDIIVDLRRQLWRAIDEGDYIQLRDIPHTEVQSILSYDIEQIDEGVMKAFEIIFKMPFVVIGSLVFMFVLSAPLATLSLVLLVVVGFVIGRLSNSLKEVSGALARTVNILLHHLNEKLRNIRVERAHGWQAYSNKKFEAANALYGQESIRFLRRRDLASPLSELFGITVVAILLYYGAILVIGGEMVAESFFAFVLAFYYMIAPAKNFSREYANTQRGILSLERLNDFLITHVHFVQENSVNLERFDGIKLEDICFEYTDGHQILHGVNLEIKAGDKIAIIGDSGEGKSTLVNLILGLIRPKRGHIFVNGILANGGASRVSIDQIVALVTQESLLYDATVLENITWPNQAIDIGLLEEALHISGIEEMADRRSFLERMVGQEGSQLSGGERQRVCLARAIYSNRPLLIMDEPTNQLDEESKDSLYPALYRAIHGRTLLLVTHDMKLLSQVDKVFKLYNGGLRPI